MFVRVLRKPPAGLRFYNGWTTEPRVTSLDLDSQHHAKVKQIVRTHLDKEIRTEIVFAGGERPPTQIVKETNDGGLTRFADLIGP
jgi:hypothetical protein